MNTLRNKRLIPFLRTIRSKIIATLLLLLVTAIAGITTAIVHTSYSEKIEEYLTTLQDLDHYHLQITSLEGNFINKDLKKDRFFETFDSYQLKKRDSLRVCLNVTLRLLQSSTLTERFGLQKTLNNLSTRTESHFVEFDSLKTLLVARGNLNYGKISQFNNQFGSLTRSYPKHSKLYLAHQRFITYIAQNQQQKLTSAVNLLKEFASDYPTSGSFSQNLSAFQQSEVFLFHGPKSLVSALERNHKVADREIELLHKTAINKSSAALKYLKITLIITVTIVVLFTLAIAWAILAWLGKPVHRLSTAIHASIDSNFSTNEIPETSRKDEIGQIGRDVEFMIAQLNTYVQKLSRNQNLLLESLNYAYRIQHALLPKKETFVRNFKDHQVIFRPQNIVSGDFYWLKESGPYVYLAVVDCTGHGVPGAFMSIMGIIILESIVNKDPHIQPSELMEQLDQQIRSTLKQEQEFKDEGMALSLVRLEPTTECIKTLFAGSRSSAILYHEDRFFELKGNKDRMGGASKEDKTFTEFEVDMMPGERIFLMTDGLKDQNNVHRERLGKRTITELLKENASSPLYQIHQQLEGVLDSYLKGTSQRDDITLVSVEL